MDTAEKVPMVPSSYGAESLATIKFLDSLQESETQQVVKITTSKSLNEALIKAIEFEAVRQSARGQN